VDDYVTGQQKVMTCFVQGGMIGLRMSMNGQSGRPSCERYSFQS
jgi:hypothetical protein